MAVVVQKYGGTSVADIARIRHVAARLVRAKDEGHDVVAVVSAMGDATDELLEMARQLTDRPSRRELDMLLATGEQVSSALLALAINSLGYRAVALTGGQGGIITDGGFTRARILRVDPARIREEMARGNIVVVAGFQGVGPGNDITTLGRGGSDATAVALAAALGAPVCDICTDVDGVYTADPRVVRNARKLPVISYEEMMELAYVGARVLQARAVEMASQQRVVIHLRSSFSDGPGTLVKEVPAVENAKPVVGVVHDPDVARITILSVPDRPGVAHRIFYALAEAGINVDMIVQSTRHEASTDVLFTVSRADLMQAMEIVQAVGRELGAGGCVFDAGVGKVSIVGSGMATHPGVAARMFGALARNGINIQVISTSEIRISCLIDAADLERAVTALHDEFELGLG
ncbi:MAG: aspartate kinase [Bacillota bacterium]|nr:aspartate kinase [Bacillota bacterium]MDI7248699.1 aspartate kinase [Bacillota bacterium]